MNKQNKVIGLGLRENGLYRLQCETKSIEIVQGLVISKESNNI